VKVLITGATGFIGQSVLARINPADEVTIISRKPFYGLPNNVSVIESDLNPSQDLFERLKEVQPDLCLHLAWEGLPDYGFDISLRNVNQASRFWQHLVEECGCSKIIATGSCWEYGKSFGACQEEDKTLINSNFSWAKHSLADFGEMLSRKYNISFIWARIFYAYGPGQRAGSLIPLIAEALRKNEQPMVKTPHNANDFIHVDDIANALVLMAQKRIPGGIYNLGSGQAVEVWKVCEYIEKAMGRDAVNSRRLRELEAQPTVNFWADGTKINQAIGWKTLIDLEEGIRQFVSTLEIKS